MSNPQNKTCAERVQSYFESRKADLDMLYNYDKHATEDIINWLVDDYGMDREELEEKSTIEVWEIVMNLQNEYGLSFFYIEDGTFENQQGGYFCYQLSYGGPSEEFRFYVDPQYKLTKAEFWFLDWFDGASLDCTTDNTIISVWDQLQDIAQAL